MEKQVNSGYRSEPAEFVRNSPLKTQILQSQVQIGLDSKLNPPVLQQQLSNVQNPGQIQIFLVEVVGRKNNRIYLETSDVTLENLHAYVSLLFGLDKHSYVLIIRGKQYGYSDLCGRSPKQSESHTVPYAHSNLSTDHSLQTAQLAGCQLAQEGGRQNQERLVKLKNGEIIYILNVQSLPAQNQILRIQTKKGEEVPRSLQISCESTIQMLKSRVAQMYQERVNRIVLVYLGRKLLRGSLKLNRVIRNAVISVGVISKQKKVLSKSYMFTNPPMAAQQTPEVIQKVAILQQAKDVESIEDQDNQKLRQIVAIMQEEDNRSLEWGMEQNQEFVRWPLVKKRSTYSSNSNEARPELMSPTIKRTMRRTTTEKTLRRNLNQEPKRDHHSPGNKTVNNSRQQPMTLLQCMPSKRLKQVKQVNSIYGSDHESIPDDQLYCEDRIACMEEADQQLESAREPRT